MADAPEPITLRVFLIGVACMIAGASIGWFLPPLVIGTDADTGADVAAFVFSLVGACLGSGLGLLFGCAAMEKWLPECIPRDISFDEATSHMKEMHDLELRDY